MPHVMCSAQYTLLMKCDSHVAEQAEYMVAMPCVYDVHVLDPSPLQAHSFQADCQLPDDSKCKISAALHT